MKLLGASAIYFAIVFGVGFGLGTIRTLLLVPRLGVRTAELLEMPLMLAAVFVAARWVQRQFLAERSGRARLVAGFIALALLLSAEVLLGMALRGLTLRETLLGRDPVSGTAYYLSLCAFALMPWFLGRSR